MVRKAKHVYTCVGVGVWERENTVDVCECTRSDPRRLNMQMAIPDHKQKHSDSGLATARETSLLSPAANSEGRLLQSKVAGRSASDRDPDFYPAV